MVPHAPQVVWTAPPGEPDRILIVTDSQSNVFVSTLWNVYGFSATGSLLWTEGGPGDAVLFGPVGVLSDDSVIVVRNLPCKDAVTVTRYATDHEELWKTTLTFGPPQHKCHTGASSVTIGAADRILLTVWDASEARLVELNEAGAIVADTVVATGTSLLAYKPAVDDDGSVYISARDEAISD